MVRVSVTELIESGYDVRRDPKDPPSVFGCSCCGAKIDIDRNEAFVIDDRRDISYRGRLVCEACKGLDAIDRAARNEKALPCLICGTPVLDDCTSLPDGSIVCIDCWDDHELREELRSSKGFR